MSLPEPVDVLVFAKALLTLRGSGTLIDGVPIWPYYLEPTADLPCILLEEAGAIHEPGVAAYLPFRVAMSAFGATEEVSAALWRVAMFVFHRSGQVTINGVMLGGAFDETGPQPRRDPNTSWPGTWGVIALYMADQVTT